MKKRIELAMTVCLLAAAFILARQGAVLVQSEKAAQKEICIVVDAGHGGSDPGKVGVNGALEKDINLSLALKLKDLLKQKGIKVVLTRDSDAGLEPADATNKKVADMQERCRLITEANPVFTVSIHQNSYTTEDIKGAQVFYYGQSSNGEKLANILQDSLVAHVDPENKRVAKANESYYLLKKTPTPTVIVECGFLSNPTEADLLLDTDYQNKLARAIYMGIIDYLESESLIPGEPDETEEPDATGEPDATEEPDTSEEPDATEESDASGQPDATEEPDISEKPATVNNTTLVVKSTTTEGSASVIESAIDESSTAMTEFAE